MKNLKVSLVSALYLSTGDTVQVETTIGPGSHAVEVRDRQGRLLFEQAFPHDILPSYGPEEIRHIMSLVSYRVREALDD